MAGEICLAFLCVLSTATDVFAVNFVDGGTHTISYAESYVYVNDGPGNTPTTLNVIPGADISHLYAYDSTLLNISGGEISHVNAWHSSTAVVTGGNISHLRAYDNTTMSVSNVHSYGHVSAQGPANSTSFDPALDPSLVDVYSGTFFTATANYSGVMNFRGGEVQRINSFSSGISNMYGGNVTEFLSAYGATTNVYGGDVASVWADRDGTINIYGGTITEFRDASSQRIGEGIVDIYGTELGWSGVAGEHLVGVLADQSTIDAPVWLEANQVRLHIIPEPSTIVLLAMGAFGLLARGWRRRR